MILAGDSGISHQHFACRGWSSLITGRFNCHTWRLDSGISHQHFACRGWSSLVTGRFNCHTWRFGHARSYPSCSISLPGLSCCLSWSCLCHLFFCHCSLPATFIDVAQAQWSKDHTLIPHTPSCLPRVYSRPLHPLPLCYAKVNFLCDLFGWWDNW